MLPRRCLHWQHTWAHSSNIYDVASQNRYQKKIKCNNNYQKSDILKANERRMQVFTWILAFILFMWQKFLDVSQIWHHLRSLLFNHFWSILLKVLMEKWLAKCWKIVIPLRMYDMELQMKIRMAYVPISNTTRSLLISFSLSNLRVKLRTEWIYCWNEEHRRQWRQPQMTHTTISNENKTETKWDKQTVVIIIVGFRCPFVRYSASNFRIDIFFVKCIQW